MRVKVLERDYWESKSSDEVTLRNQTSYCHFIRNLFLCLGIIEVIVILSDENHERLGDKVTKTIVVKIK